MINSAISSYLVMFLMVKDYVFQIPLLALNIQDSNNNACNLSLLRVNALKNKIVNKFNAKIKRFQLIRLIIYKNTNFANQ